MGKHVIKALLIVCLACQALAPMAEVKIGSIQVPIEVIEDRGGQSISSYLPKKKVIDNHEATKRHPDWRRKGLINSRYPIVTKAMSVGPIGPEEGKEIKFQFATRPMFIIGYDPVSIGWLKSNKHHLAEKKAIGMVVNVENAKQMEELMQAVDKAVFLQPTQGDGLAKSLKIKHYPFYMDRSGILR